jgi:sialate O-acetylesterase
MKSPHTSYSILAAALSCGILHAEVKPNPLFTDGAVLQRGQAVPVWGTANDGEKVSVEFDGQTVSTTAQGGKWRVELKPLEAGGPHTMKISGENKIEVKDLLVGEVWVCSGQSNMEWKFKQSASANEERPKAKHPGLRMFTVTRTTSAVPLAEPKGSWVVCSPETVDGFSGVGYFFARDLHEKLGVPVGMIHSSWGGTPAQAWTSLEGFGDAPELQGFAAQSQAAFTNYPAASAAYQEKLSKYETAKKAWDETTGKAFEEARKAWNQQAAEAKKNGQKVPPALQPASKPPQRPGDPNGGSSSPSALYNGMIAPIVPYAIKGAIWYQGESNAGNSKQYRTLFPAMIADWRAKWNQGDFPFYFVQIAPFKGQPAEIREAQFLTLSKSKNTAMAVTTDVGNANDIHPKQKQPVGHRLALAARALVYGEKIEYSGPLYDGIEVKGDKAAISFAHVGGGLVAKDGDLKGFTIAGADGKFVPAKAEIVGANVVVSAEGVSDPKAVRYGWENVPDVNLFNKEGLPASPFRTDVD